MRSFIVLKPDQRNLRLALQFLNRLQISLMRVYDNHAFNRVVIFLGIIQKVCQRMRRYKIPHNHSDGNFH